MSSGHQTYAQQSRRWQNLEEIRPWGRELHSIYLSETDARYFDQQISICLAETDESRVSATSLINRMYSWRGYGSGHELSSGVCEATFTASTGARMVGTLTLAADSSTGLGLDKTFHDELQVFRQRPGTKLCEIKKFAVDADLSGKSLLAAIFHTVFIYGSHRYGSTDLLIEVNPRHVKFYETMLGFERVGPLKTNMSVSAPSQLMSLRVADIRGLIDAYRGKELASSRSLYPYFCSPHEEEVIRSRIMSFEEANLVDGEFCVPAHVLSPTEHCISSSAAFAM